MKREKQWITADCETDPFKFGRRVDPFIWAIYDGTTPTVFEGLHATRDFLDYIAAFDGYVYAHNGGRFDWMMGEVLERIEKNEPLMLINNRIARARVGKCELRDSFLVLPAPLAAFEKSGFNYEWLEAEQRGANMEKIREYIISDVVNLYKPLARYFAEHGQQLTQAGASIKAWEGMGGTKRRYSVEHDEKYRPYYFGGRCEVFEYANDKRDAWKVYDVNSAYPFAMCEMHPLGTEYFTTRDLSDLVGGSFWDIEAVSRGALPLRDEKGGVCFPNDDTPRKFKVTGWEVMAGIETGTLDVINALGRVPVEFETVKPYVERFMKDKENAEKVGDKTGRLIAKIFLNSCYGKFATNPRNYRDFMLSDYDPQDGWQLYQMCEGGLVWYRPSDNDTYYDVAMGASITGHARANLWRAICASENVIYCDTDSIFCTASDVVVGDKLGQWECEAEATRAWIAGKKLYSLELPDGSHKIASKGVRASHDDIARVCAGEVVNIKRDAPTMKLDGSQSFIARNIRIT